MIVACLFFALALAGIVWILTCRMRSQQPSQLPPAAVPSQPPQPPPAPTQNPDVVELKKEMIALYNGLQTVKDKLIAEREKKVPTGYSTNYAYPYNNGVYGQQYGYVPQSLLPDPYANVYTCPYANPYAYAYAYPYSGGYNWLSGNGNGNVPHHRQNPSVEVNNNISFGVKGVASPASPASPASLSSPSRTSSRPRTPSRVAPRPTPTVVGV